MRVGSLESPVSIDGTQKVIYDSGELSAATTSITISGLDGNSDEEYELIVRLVSSYSANLYLSFNSDVGNNYGQQNLTGVDTTPSAVRITTGIPGWIIGGGNGSEDICFSQTKIKSKSGYLRTGIGKFTSKIATTTVTDINLRGYSWNNTADNITQMVISCEASGIGIGSRVILLKKVTATDGMKCGELDIKGKVYGVWEEIYTKEIVNLVSNGDIDDEDMADITDWTDGDIGAGASTQVTFDTRTCMKLDSGSIGDYAYRIQDVGTFGARTVLSLRVYCDALGTKASQDYFSFYASNGASQLYIIFASDGLYHQNNVTFNELGTDLVVQDVWQNWTFDVDWSGKTFDVYLNGNLKVADTAFDYAGGLNGEVEFLQYGATTANRIVYVDWLKVGTDTVAIGADEIQGSQTSLTVSELTGNTDVLYRLRTRIIDGGATAGDYKLSFNADTTASNYGLQYLTGSSTSVGANRNTASLWVIGNGSGVGSTYFIQTLIHAKSGYVRTGIVESAGGIATTTVNDIRMVGVSWNNTANEMTSMTITGDQANGLGVGTEIVLERLNL